MSSYFCFSVTYLAPAFHGTGDGGAAEWPPSPLRLFQAVVAGAASRWRGEMGSLAVPSLRWLEEIAPPAVVAPPGRQGAVVCVAVPDNDMDIVAAAWARRREPKKDPSKLKSLKSVRAMQLVATDDAPATVHYLWTLANTRSEVQEHSEALCAAARSITHLGWGVDMVAANARVITEEEAANLTGEWWRPTEDQSARGYRVPVQGTIDALIDRYEAFLNRIGQDGFNPVPPLTAFRVVGYRRATDPPARPFAAFSLLRPDASGYRAFDTVRRGVAVAGMMRCAAKKAAMNARPDDEKWINQVVLGHGEAPGEPHKPVAGPRLAFLPIPSIQPRGEGQANVVGEIRRVLVAVMPGDHHDKTEASALADAITPQDQSDRDLSEWTSRALSGMDLIPDRGDGCTERRAHASVHPCEMEWAPPEPGEKRRAVATLSRIPDNERTVQRYTRPGSAWATVTPMVLPGYDDPRHYRRRLKKGDVNADEQKRLLARLDDRIDELIRKAIVQGGFSEVLAKNALIDWRGTGFWPGTDLANRYVVPKKLKRFPRYHVRIQWRDPSGTALTIGGPICLGAGRFFGLGLFAVE
jgi:CRISPR-associated protein Csb2